MEHNSSAIPVLSLLSPTLVVALVAGIPLAAYSDERLRGIMGIKKEVLVIHRLCLVLVLMSWVVPYSIHAGVLASVILKDGSIIHGDIVEMVGGTLKVEAAFGVGEPFLITSSTARFRATERTWIRSRWTSITRSVSAPTPLRRTARSSSTRCAATKRSSSTATRSRARGGW